MSPDRMNQGAGPADDASHRSPLGLHFRTCVEWVDKASLVLIVFSMGAMASMVAVQVFWRYVLGSSIDSADELSRLFFIWAMFLAIPQGIKYSIHVGIDLIINLFNKTLKEVIFRIVSAAGVVLMAVVFYAALISTIDRWSQLMPTLPVTASVYYIAVLIGAAHSFLHLLLYAWMGSAIWEDRDL